MKPIKDRNDWRLVNCARCGCELLGASMLPYRHSLAKLTDLEFVADRIDSRPFCASCLDAEQRRILKEAWL